MATRLYENPIFLEHNTPEGHPERADRLRSLNIALEHPNFARLERLQAEQANEDAVTLAHPEEHLFSVMRQIPEEDDQINQIESDTYASQKSLQVALTAIGGAIAAVDDVMTGKADNAFVAGRPPGHHAEKSKAMGFCLFNTVAIAARHVQKTYGVERVAIVDWDVHHGNGTQTIYYERDDVLTLSIHQQRAYPRGYTGEHDTGSGAGAGLNVNIPLPPGSGHEAYLHAMQRIVLPALERYRPQLIIVACGYDASGVDPLGRMLLHSDSYRELTRLTREAAERLCDGKLVLVHEGGYAEAYVPFCGLAAIEALSGLRTEVQDPLLAMLESQQPDAQTVAFQKTLIDQLL